MDSKQLIAILRNDSNLAKYIVQRVSKQEIKKIVSIECRQTTLVLQAINTQDQNVWVELVFDRQQKKAG